MSAKPAFGSAIVCCRTVENCGGQGPLVSTSATPTRRGFPGRPISSVFAWLRTRFMLAAWSVGQACIRRGYIATDTDGRKLKGVILLCVDAHRLATLTDAHSRAHPSLSMAVILVHTIACTHIQCYTAFTFTLPSAHTSPSRRSIARLPQCEASALRSVLTYSDIVLKA